MPSELRPSIISNPGSLGINTQMSFADQQNGFALTAENFQFDDEGRVSSRPAHYLYNYQPATATNIGTLLWDKGTTTNVQLIFAASNNQIHTTSNPSSSWSTLSGGTAWTGDSWRTTSLNNKTYFFQRGTIPKVYRFATGVFADCGGTPPNANVVESAFGRLWAANTSTTDRQTLYWSVLQDGENWTGTGAGQVNLTNVISKQYDQITAIKQFNNVLAVFFFDTIVLMANPFVPSIAAAGTITSGTAMTVSDIIEGMGCVSPQLIVNTGEDIIFLSKTGLRSLGRVIQERSNPIGEISQNVHDEVLRFAKNAWESAISNSYSYKMMYHPYTRQLIMSDCLGSDATTTYVFDLGHRQQGGAAAVFKWTHLDIRAFCSMEVGSTTNPHIAIAASVSGASEGVGAMGALSLGTTSPNETYIICTYKSQWLELDKGFAKIMKQVFAHVDNPNAMQGSGMSAQIFVDYAASTAVSTDLADSTSAVIDVLKFNVGGTGHLIQLGIVFSTLSTVALQRLSLLYKRGRIMVGV